MKKSILVTLCILMGGLLTALPASAEGEITLQAIAQQEVKVVAEDGTETTKIIPAVFNDTATTEIYTITARNNSDKPVESVVIHDPIPVHMTYVAGSATSEGSVLTFSVDGGKSFDQPDKLQVIDESGAARQAEAKDYTDIRWTLVSAIPPSGEKSVSFRALLK
jgi:uncharacterized repeat protein (TIGR01451 family)